MKRFKRSISLALVFIGVLGTVFRVSASELDSASEIQDIIAEGIYEGEDLAAVAEKFGYEMMTEDGYELVSISLSFCENSCESSSFENPLIPATIGDYVGNINKKSMDVYFPDLPIASNWFDGPLSSLTKTYTRTVEVKYDCTVSIGDDVFKAGLGFGKSDSCTESTTWTRPAITASQKINIKEYGVYEHYTYTVYNLFGNEKGTGNAYNPIGLYVAQATYSK